MSFSIRIKEKLKSNPHVEPVIRKLSIPYFWLEWKISDFRASLRKRGILNPKKFNYIKSLKNTHAGERCFIVATGPSLTYEDLNAIKDEFSFSMNSCVLALEKTDWIPSLVGYQDEYVYQKVESVLLKLSETKLKDKIIIADFLTHLCPSAKRFNQYPHNFLNTKYDRKKTKLIKFSKDCFCDVYGNYSIIFGLMQIAIYMGFTEIYLLGCDCTYKGSKKNFIEHGAVDPNFDIAGHRLIYIHSKFKEFADSMGVRVYNCTRGGMLEEYPRKTLEEVLANGE